ncbi:GntR family transcriptional regulator [Desulfosediminicola sp.]|uniref:GntR family transcriptional regulator n=1 Tax=Desulfosediminicola sp. TaxID=2886825 RepID=UPI003AF2366F
MPVPHNPQQINRFSMREEVYNTLLKWIMEGVLRPGEKILDKDLAERLGVSRTPVREALRRLEDKELIESAANRWTRVARISLKEPEKFYPIIWTLEELAVSECIDLLDDEDFHQMEAINRSIQKATKNNDPVKASWADVEFHQVYIAKSANDYLISILRDLKIKFRRIEVCYFDGTKSSDESFMEHNQILGALRNRNLAETQHLIRTNWQNSLKRLQALDLDQDQKEDDAS